MRYSRAEGAVLLELLIFRTGDLSLVSRLEAAMAADPVGAGVAVELLNDDGMLDLVAFPTLSIGAERATFQMGNEVPRVVVVEGTDERARVGYDFVGVTVDALRLDEDELAVDVSLDHAGRPGIDPPIRASRSRTVASDDAVALLTGGDLVVIVRPRVVADPAADEAARRARALELRALDTGSRRTRAEAVETLLGPPVLVPLGGD